MEKTGLERYREKLKNGLVVKKNPNRPSMSKAIKEKCRDCMCDYQDGRDDCGIVKCSLYYWQPYGALKKERKLRKEQSQLLHSRSEGLVP